MKPLVLFFLALSITLTTESLDFTLDTDFSSSFLWILDTFKEDFISKVVNQYEIIKDNKNQIVKFIKKHQFLGNSLKSDQIIGKEILNIDYNGYDQIFSKLLNISNITSDFDGKLCLREYWKTLIFITSNYKNTSVSIDYLIIFQRKVGSSIDIAFVLLKDMGEFRRGMNFFSVLCNDNLNEYDFGHQPGTPIPKHLTNLLINYLNLNAYKLLNDFFRSSEDFPFPVFE